MPDRWRGRFEDLILDAERLAQAAWASLVMAGQLSLLLIPSASAVAACSEHTMSCVHVSRTAGLIKLLTPIGPAEPQYN